MPILLKKIEASIISLFGGDGESDFTAPVQLLQQFLGEAGREDYIKLAAYEAFTQDFTYVGEANFCSSTPISFGLGKCNTYEDLNIDY
jgi:hypothetical protein